MQTHLLRIRKNAKNLEKKVTSVQPPTLRSKHPTFYFQSHCIHCTFRAVDEDGTRLENLWVSTTDCQEAMVRCCETRGDE